MEYKTTKFSLSNEIGMEMTLQARVLKEKYCKGKDIGTLTTRHQNGSNAWRGIMKNPQPNQKRRGYAIADGSRTKLWIHKRLDGMVLMDQEVREIPNDYRNRLVCDYQSRDMGWDWDQLSCFLPSTILQQVVRLTLFEKRWVTTSFRQPTIRVNSLSNRLWPSSLMNKLAWDPSGDRCGRVRYHKGLECLLSLLCITRFLLMLSSSQEI